MDDINLEEILERRRKQMAKYEGLGLTRKQRVNAVIADYMGKDKEHPPTNFTESLDSLVPVWDKLKIEDRIMYSITFAGKHFNKDSSPLTVKIEGYYSDNFFPLRDSKITLQEAAAQATAYAIMTRDIDE